MRIPFIIFFLVIAFILKSQSTYVSSFGKNNLRVSIENIIKNPIVKVEQDSGLREVLSYRVTLNINGIINTWDKLSNDTLNHEIINKMLNVSDDMPKYNNIFIDSIKYYSSTGDIKKGENLFLWLAKKSDCDNEYLIFDKKYKNGQIRYEYFYCMNSYLKIACYKRDGTFYRSLEQFYSTNDTITIEKKYNTRNEIYYMKQVKSKNKFNTEIDYILHYDNGNKAVEIKRSKNGDALWLMYKPDGTKK